MIHPPTATSQTHYPAPSRTRRMSLSPPLRSCAPSVNRLSLPPLPAPRSPTQALAAISSHSKPPTHDKPHRGSFFDSHRSTYHPLSSSSGKVVCDLDTAETAAKRRREAATPENVMSEPFSLRIEEIVQDDNLNVDLGGAPTPDLEGKEPSPPPQYVNYLPGLRQITLLTPSEEVSEFLPFDPAVGGTGAGLALDFGMAVGKEGVFGLGIDDGGVESEDDDDERDALRRGIRILSDYKAEDVERTSTPATLSPTSSTTTIPSPHPCCPSYPPVDASSLSTEQLDVLGAAPSFTPASKTVPHGMRPLLLLSRRNFPIPTVDTTSPALSTSPTPPARSASLNTVRGTPALRGLGISVGVGPTSRPSSSPLVNAHVKPAAAVAVAESPDRESSFFKFGGDSDSATSEGASDGENDSIFFSPIRLPPTVSSALASLASALAPAHLSSPSHSPHTSEAGTGLKSCMRRKGSSRTGEKDKSKLRWAEVLVECEPVGKPAGNRKSVAARMTTPSPVCADGSPTKRPRSSRSRLVTLQTTTSTAAYTVWCPPTLPPPTPSNLPLVLLRELLAGVSTLAALLEWTVILLAKMWIMVRVVYTGMVADTAKPKSALKKSRTSSRATMLPAEL